MNRSSWNALRALFALVTLVGCEQRSSLSSPVITGWRTDAGAVATPDAVEETAVVAPTGTPDAAADLAPPDAATVTDGPSVVVDAGSSCEEWPIPSGKFVVVSAGNGSSCGIRTNGALACWGYPLYPASAVPAGAFLRVSANTCTCGVRESGRLACWGCPTAAPTGAIFQDVGRGDEALCALRLDGTMSCWGPPVRTYYVPAYKFDSMSAGAYFTCGIEVSAGWAVCWDPRNNTELATLTRGPFRQVGAGRFYACGLLLDGTPQCWPLAPGESRTPPVTKFREISVGEFSACGLDTDGAITCWGSNYAGEATPPTGARFQTISVGSTHSCGILLDGTLTCWGVIRNPCAPG